MAVTADRALVLRRFPYGETSLVVHALTSRHGRVHLLAKGAYRPKSRFYAVLDLFDTLDLEWSHRPGRELQQLRSGDIATRRAKLADDLPRFRSALTVLELLELGSVPDQPCPALFARAEHALDELLSAEDAPAALARFELGFLDELGLAPALACCASCGGEAPPSRDERVAGGPRAWFSAGAGGRLCAHCAAEARRSGLRVGTLPEAVLARGSHWLSKPDEDNELHAARSGERADSENVRDFVARFLEYQLQTRPKSYRSFLSVPNRNRPVERVVPSGGPRSAP